MPGTRKSRTTERPLLWPLTPVYAAALALKNAAYARGWVRPQQLRCPVISVGNLSVGGSGKTPFVIYLAQLLTSHGIGVDVLSRGYGRVSQATLPVDPGGTADEFGDEPLLIARGARVPVFVGASRLAAGILAEQTLDTRFASASPGALAAQPRHVHLLDDGFQHRQLLRAVDLVILHASDLAATLLPSGRLREPLGALQRATVIIVRSAEPAESDAPGTPDTLEQWHELLRGHKVAAPVWVMRRTLTLPAGALGERVVAFCGIAHPSEFFRSLSQAGATLAGTRAFKDHHAFTDADVTLLQQQVKQQGAHALLTTEKDLVRLSPAHQARLRAAADLLAVPLRATLDDEEAFIAFLLTKLAR